MDSLIAAAARALAAGDTLGALKHVALRDDPPALALRGIAMARLGELVRARELLRRAARAFGAHEELARARCVVAEAEVALALRELGGSPRPLAAAIAALEARGDRANAAQARLIAARRALLLGRLDDAAASLPTLDAQAPPALRAVAELTAAELALRSLHTAAAEAALARAMAAAERAGLPALQAEVAEARAALERPAARRVGAGAEQPLRLGEVAALRASGALVVDACRHGLGAGDTWLPLARRPLLFVLARALAEAWPGEAPREALIEHVFRTRHPDETPPRAAARGDRPAARAGGAAGRHRGHRARLPAAAARRARAGGAGAAGGWRAGRAAGAAVRWRRLVHVGAGAGAGREPAQRAARAGRAAATPAACAAVGRARVAALAGAAAGRIHDDLVTPCCAAV